ncbi:TetR/AcrR family transcriptional regulator [Arthrobacter sp. SDTb3-6]|uniref:TetR/AcrR family transcriptional regulator n=1 Tax=Arthrobacter sp. SDTb3-6 TaxID=2713571 RepID=UPI00159DF054|nr:TetR/AcrR family transcriptional regulator [Arthrobacter sp. SDTb3-6]NVM98995.1 TetR/AcrR family transcriptional regulator [Arthrobacter sp. SDTb3-6]
MARISADDRRSEFVRSAARVIANHGVAAATTRRIAAEANAPLASLHYCFRNKDELLQEVYNYLSRDYAMALPPVPASTAGLAHVMEAHALRVWDRMVQNPHEQVTTFELLLRRFRVDDGGQPQALAMNQSMYNGWISSTMALFTDAAVAAVEPIPSNLEQVTRLFISGIDGISMQHLADPDEARSKELVKLLALSLSRALAY